MMLRLFFLYCILIVNSYSDPINVTMMNEGIDIIPKVQYFQDKGSRLDLQNILNDDVQFQTTSSVALSFGYDYNDTIWLKFALMNPTANKIKKILEYDNVHIGEFILYDIDSNSSFISGYNHQSRTHYTTTYPIEIALQPFETKNYILKVKSNITSLNIKLSIWDPYLYKIDQIKHQIILALFFGGIVALLLYNLSLYFFIKDKTYLYYCAYLLGMLVHTSFFTGILNIYIIPGFYLKERYIADIMIYFLIIFIAPFVRNYLHLAKSAPRLNTILYYLPFILTVVLFLRLFDLISVQLSILLYLLCAPLMIFIGIYAVLLGIREAIYFLAGWSIMISSMLLMALYTTGVLPVFAEFPYILELGYFIEAILFSIGLAARINILKKQKEEADARLIEQQKKEQLILTKQVNERTQELKLALEEKDVLFKELHHRVKNNLQMVISLLRLQNNKLKNQNLKHILISAQNRIYAMSNLHQLLYKQNNISKIDTQTYFQHLVNEIQSNVNRTSTINISINIEVNLSMNQSVYCGLIINELISNAFKHAFDEHTKNANIAIGLSTEKNRYKLEISDNGKGFDTNKRYTQSLGLELVKTLIVKQLKGTYVFSNENGTKIIIRF